MGSRTISYDLMVTYAVTPADDIEILDEGTYACDRYDSSADALGDLGRFIRDNGSPNAWSETGLYEVASCWLPYGEGTEISYSARMDRVAVVEDQGWVSSRSLRHPALVTWGRLVSAPCRASPLTGRTPTRSRDGARRAAGPRGGEEGCVTR